MRILIFEKKDKLKPIGGALGYLYNVKYQMDKIGDTEIDFLDNDIRHIKITFIIKKIFMIIATIYYKLIYKNSFLREIIKYRLSSNFSGRTNLNQYDIVHFHSTAVLYSQKADLKKYKGLTLLTSHSPKVMYKEIIEDCINDIDYKTNKEVFDGIEEFDEYAFKRAEYIIFPCPGAEEPYYHSWPKYKDIRDESKIRYIPTGVLPVDCKKTREEIRTELNIPQDAIVMSFVGRHNEVKGYDILQDIFSKLDNVYVVCCGNISAIKPPKSDRWIEVGWTTDPYSYVGASDIYMLPNRETYFDIAMLQTLSIGKCSVISNTGGNKEFVNTPGVKLYDTVDEAVKCIKEFILMSMEEKTNLECLQRLEFEKKYTIEVFYKNYKNTLKQLLEEKSNGK